MLQVPTELIELCLQHVEPVHWPDLLRCALVCKQWHSIARSDVVWRPLYSHYFWRTVHVQKEQQQESVYGKCVVRLQRNFKAMTSLELLSNGQCSARKEAFGAMDMSVYDALITRIIGIDSQSDRISSIPQQLQQDGTLTVSPNLLTEHYYASELTHHIQRKNACRALAEIATDEDATNWSFEDALLIFSQFRGTDPSTVKEKLDLWASRIASTLPDGLYASEGESSLEQSIKVEISCIADGLQFICGMTRAAPRSYHDLMNNFVDAVVLEQQPALPMSCIWVFVAICDRLGIAAKPIGYPGTIIARIDGRYINHVYTSFKEPIFYDFFHQTIASRRDLHNNLRSMRQLGTEADEATLDGYLQAASPKALLIRSARNIVNSLNIVSTETTRNVAAAIYCAVLALRLVAGVQINSAALVAVCEQHFSFDAGFLAGYITSVDGLPNEQLLELDAHADELDIASVESSSQTERQRILHPLGQIFRHRSFGYLGVIVKRDATCCATAEWQQTMNVRALSEGAAQPFYNVMAADASNRYVAQQNIEPITNVPHEVLATFMKKHFKLGRFFRHVDMARGRLLLSKEMGQANPEDAEEQELMLESGQLVPTRLQIYDGGADTVIAI